MDLTVAGLACLGGMGLVETGRRLWGKGREGWEKGLAAGCLAGWGVDSEEGDWRVTGEGVGVEGAQRPLWENQRRQQGW